MDVRCPMFGRCMAAYLAGVRENSIPVDIQSALAALVIGLVTGRWSALVGAGQRSAHHTYIRFAIGGARELEIPRYGAREHILQLHTRNGKVGSWNLEVLLFSRWT